MLDKVRILELEKMHERNQKNDDTPSRVIKSNLQFLPTANRVFFSVVHLVFFEAS